MASENSPQQSNVREIFLEALEKATPQEREAYLDGACRSDVALRERIEGLLKSHRQDDFLAVPAVAMDRIGQAAACAPSEKPGAVIGRYKLLEKIGEGGCGLVYVAEQEEPVRRRVALKVIKLGMDTRQVIARFEAERQALALMDHPNIAKVLDAGETEGGRPFFVMELVKGIPITRYCDENQMNTQGRLNLFIQVCQAIQHAHQKGIIHRDLKPSNILVANHDGVPVPKVIDFGIAKATTDQRLTDKTLYTAIEQFIGTPAYMSPEQANLSGLDVDTRSDIYSLGVLLYELLTGRTPFDAQELIKDGLDAIRRTIREVEPPPPSKRLSTLQAETLTATSKQHGTESLQLLKLVRGDLDWIVMKCLEKDRTRRYETASGLAADLKRHLNNEPVLARPPSAAYKFQKAFRRNKLVFSAATAVAAALVAGMGVTTWQAVEARRARREAETAQKVGESERKRADAQARKASESQQQSRQLLYAADMNLAQQALKVNNLGRARRLLDNHRPQAGEEDLRGWEWRYLWQLTRSTALVTLTNRPLNAFSVSFSPDGTRLAVGWEDGRVDLWDVPARQFVQVLTDPKDGSSARAAFSPLRNLLAVTSELKTVMLYDLDSGRQSILWRAPDQGKWDVRDLEFSQDGSKLVIYAATKDRGDAVWVVNVFSAKIESSYPTDGTPFIFFGAARLSPDNRRLYLSRTDLVNYRYGIQCLDLTTGREVWQTERVRDNGVTALAISPDGRMLASGSGYEDPTIHIWDAATGRIFRPLQGHTSWVSKLLFTKDGHLLISAATDQTIRIWDTATWTEKKVLRGHTDEIYGVAVSETGHLFASAGKGGDIMLWNKEGDDANDGYLRLPENLLVNQVMPLDRSQALLWADDKPPGLLNLGRGASLGLLPGLGPSTNILGFQSNWLCHWDGKNQILFEEWSGSEFTRRGAVTTLEWGKRPTSLAFNPARRLVAWAEPAASNSLFVATFATPGPPIELKSQTAGMSPVRFSDDGQYLAAVAPQWAALRLWDVDAGQSVVTLGEPIADIAFAAGGRVLVALVALYEKNEIRFYHLDHPERPPRYVLGRQQARELAVSPDGRLVAATSSGGVVRLCNALTGTWIEDLHGHMNAAFGVAFSPDGRRLISAGGASEAVKLWDVGTGQELLDLSGTGGGLRRAVWSADGDTILVGAPWQAWHAPSWQEIAAAEAKDPSSQGSRVLNKATVYERKF